MCVCVQDQGNIYDHTVQLSSEAYTPKDSTSIPTGEIKPVSDSVFDLTSSAVMSKERLDSIENQVGVDNSIY